MNINNKENNAAITRINEILDLTIPFQNNPTIDANKVLFKIENNLSAIKNKLENSVRHLVRLDMVEKLANDCISDNEKLEISMNVIDDTVVLNVKDKKSEKTLVELHSDVIWGAFPEDVTVYDSEDNQYSARIHVGKIDSSEIKVVKGDEQQVIDSGLFAALEMSFYSRYDAEDPFSSISDCEYKGRRILDLDNLDENDFVRQNEKIILLNEITSKEKTSELIFAV